MATIPFPTTAVFRPSELLTFIPGLDPVHQQRRIQDYCQTAYDEGLNWLSRSEEASEQATYIDALLGKQWPKGRPSYKASPVNNLLLRTLEQTIAVLTDIRLAYKVSSHNQNYNSRADILTKTAKSWWVTQNVDVQLAGALVYAYLSTGYLRIVFNKNLMNGLGDFQVIPEGINSILPIGAAQQLQDWEGVIYDSVRPLSWFRRTYPLTGHRVTASAALSNFQRPIVRPGFVGRFAFPRLAPQMQRYLGGQPQYQESVVPQAPYREFWLKDYSENISENTICMGERGANWYYEVAPGKPLYPRGRLIVTGGEDFVPLYDGPNFFWHGRFPIIPLRLKPVPWSFHGISELRTKLPLQNVVNSILAGVLDMVKKATNPPLLFPSNAFTERIAAAFDPSKPNLKLAYSPNVGMQTPNYAQPPPMPAYVINALQYAQQQLQDDSGLLDVSALSRKKVSPAGDTLSELKESQQSIMRLRGRYIEDAIQELGEQMTPNFLQMYEFERRIHMHGIKGATPEDFDWNPGTMVPSDTTGPEYIRNFGFEITPDSLLNANREQTALLMMALRRQGDVDRETLFNTLDLGAIFPEVQQRLDLERQKSLKEAVIATLIQASPQLAALFAGVDGPSSGPAQIGGGPPQAPGEDPGAAPAPVVGDAGSPYPGGKGSRNPENLLTEEGL